MLIKNLINLDKKLYFEDLNLLITDKKNQVINLKKINLSNYGYKKNMKGNHDFKCNPSKKIKSTIKNIS